MNSWPAWLPNSRLSALPVSPSRRGPWRALVLVLLLGLGVRLIWLDHIPTNITADEADNLQTIFRIQETGDPGLFGLDWKPAPAFSMYLDLAFVSVFGASAFGLRAASAVLSTLALLPFYALARRVVDPSVALAATAMLETGRWYLHFSRSGWENVHAALYALLAAWALTIALERQQLRWFVVAGAAAALGLYGYFAGRFILPALLAYAPLAWWWARGPRGRIVLSGRTGPVSVTPSPLGARQHARVVLRGFGVLTVTALLLFLPQMQTIRENWDHFTKRTRVVYVFDHPRPYLGEMTDLGILRVQLERTAVAFLQLDGRIFNNGRYSPPGKSIYDPVTGLLFLCGLGLSLWRWRATALWWTMLFVPLLGTQVLTSGTPDAARAVMIAPFIYLFVALALDGALQLVVNRWQGVARLALVLGVVAVAAVNVHSYFQWIQSPAAAEVRRPAVEYADYPRWQASVRCGLRGGAWGMTPVGGVRCVHLPR